MILQCGSVIGWIIAPCQDVHHILKPRTSEYIILHGKRDFTDVTKLKIWDGKIILYYLGGPNIITGVLIRKQEGQREDDVTVQAEVGVMFFEDGRRGHKPKNTGCLQKLEKARILF